MTHLPMRFIMALCAMAAGFLAWETHNPLYVAMIFLFVHHIERKWLRRAWAWSVRIFMAKLTRVVLPDAPRRVRAFKQEAGAIVRAGVETHARAASSGLHHWDGYLSMAWNRPGQPGFMLYVPTSAHDLPDFVATETAELLRATLAALSPLQRRVFLYAFSTRKSWKDQQPRWTAHQVLQARKPQAEPSPVLMLATHTEACPA